MSSIINSLTTEQFDAIIDTYDTIEMWLAANATIIVDIIM